MLFFGGLNEILKIGVDPKIFAYQFKKGEESCGNGEKDKGIDKAFWIKGKARKSTHGNSSYHVATSSELESFFGVSGNYWTPAVWEQLKKRVSYFIYWACNCYLYYSESYNCIIVCCGIRRKK